MRKILSWIAFPGLRPGLTSFAPAGLIARRAVIVAWIITAAGAAFRGFAAGPAWARLFLVFRGFRKRGVSGNCDPFEGTV